MLKLLSVKLYQYEDRARGEVAEINLTSQSVKRELIWFSRRESWVQRLLETTRLDTGKVLDVHHLSTFVPSATKERRIRRIAIPWENHRPRGLLSERTTMDLLRVWILQVTCQKGNLDKGRQKSGLRGVYDQWSKISMHEVRRELTENHMKLCLLRDSSLFNRYLRLFPFFPFSHTPTKTIFHFNHHNHHYLRRKRKN